MLLSEFMENRTPSIDFEGFTTADDYVLAVDFDGASKDPNDWYVGEVGINEHSSALNPKTATSQYIRTGEVETRTGTKFQINVSGDRYIGDEFQDKALSHSMRYGTGSAVVKNFVYFNMLTGVGEIGKGTLSVSDSPSGAAGANASFSMTISAQGVPEEYTYEAPVAP